MNRMQEEYHSYYHTLLEDTFGMVMRLSQWCFTAPYPLEPYQRLTPANQQRFYVLRLLKILLSVLIFGAFIASPVLMYFTSANAIFLYAVPMSIKIMYYIQTALQVSSLCYVVFVYQFRTGIHQYYFNRIRQVLEQFGRRDIDVGLRKVSRTVRMLMLLFPVHIGVLVIQAGLYAGDWGYLPKFMMFMIADLMGRTIILQYVTILGTVLILLRQMNDTMESLLVTTLDVHTVRCVQIRLTADDRRTIEKVRFLQLDLMRVVTKVNGGEFGMLLCMSIITCFMFTNISLLQIYQGMGQAREQYDRIIFRVVTVVLKFTLCIIVAYPNRLIQKQTLRLYNVLHQLSILNNGTVCSNIIKRFITQTSIFYNAHEACGVIPIDMTLIFKVVSGVTSIFVVLVQFSDSFKKG